MMKLARISLLHADCHLEKYHRPQTRLKVIRDFEAAVQEEVNFQDSRKILDTAFKAIEEAEKLAVTYFNVNQTRNLAAAERANTRKQQKEVRSHDANL
jgi:hypothetical protein